MYGLALEGGGVKGAFHMGAVKALLEEGYEFGGVAGTSIGALNAAVIAQGDFEAGYKLWERIDSSMLFDFGEAQYKKFINRRFDGIFFLKLAAGMKAAIGNRGIDTTKIRKAMESVVDEEKLRNSDVEFGLVTVSITDLKPLELYKEDIPKGKIIDYIMASASFPGFKLNPIEDKYYIDGGFYDNCPINLLAKKGFKEIIAVRTLSLGIVQQVRHRDLKITNIFPSEDLGMPLDFDRDLIKRNMQMGYYDTIRCLKGLKGRKYYIIPENEDSIFDTFCKLPDILVQELQKTLNAKEMPAKRMLFENIIPQLANLMGFKAVAGYQDILIGLMEVLAEEHGVNKYRIYSMKEFMSEIKAHIEGKDKITLKRTNMNKGKGISLNKKLTDALNRKHILKKAAKSIFSEIC